MPRPDLTPLACVNADCQQFGRRGQGNFAIRKVYGQDIGADLRKRFQIVVI